MTNNVVWWDIKPYATNQCYFYAVTVLPVVML